ncbi:hypothetical protein Vi05172_g1996 [Venturia inaequalis]|nr:hypothetical protein Vi05172_g1996 [Venturia inaequalis]
MHFTSLAIITPTLWSAFVLAAPIPTPQSLESSNIPTPAYITTGSAETEINAHATLLGTYHKGQDGIYASNGFGTYEKSDKGTTLSNSLGSIEKSGGATTLSSALGSIEKTGGATTYSSALGSFTYGKDGVKLGGPKSKPKKAQENVPQDEPQDWPQNSGPSAGWS